MCRYAICFLRTGTYRLAYLLKVINQRGFLMHRHLYNMNIMLRLVYEYVVYWIWVGIKYMYTTRSFKILKILFTDTFSINNYKYLCCSM